MCEKKTPQPGEWWEWFTGEPVFVTVVGAVNSRGLWVNKDNAIRHLPDCTGFDYKIPPKPQKKTITLTTWLVGDRENDLTAMETAFKPTFGWKIIHKLSERTVEIEVGDSHSPDLPSEPRPGS